MEARHELRAHRNDRTQIGGEAHGGEALLVVGVSFHEHRAALQAIRDGGRFDAVEWLEPDQVDEAYWRLLPSGAGEISIEEIAELSSIFGKGGELQAERLS